MARAKVVVEPPYEYYGRFSYGDLGGFPPLLPLKSLYLSLKLILCGLILLNLTRRLLYGVSPVRMNHWGFGLMTLTRGYWDGVAISTGSPFGALDMVQLGFSRPLWTRRPPPLACRPDGQPSWSAVHEVGPWSMVCGPG